MADFRGVAHPWQPCRMHRLEVSISLCMGGPNTSVFPDMTYIPKCSFFEVCSMCKKWKKFITPFSRNFEKQLFLYGGNLKKRVITKMKKTAGDIDEKLSETKFQPNWSSRSCYISLHRRTHTHTHASKSLGKKAAAIRNLRASDSASRENKAAVLSIL